MRQAAREEAAERAAYLEAAEENECDVDEAGPENGRQAGANGSAPPSQTQTKFISSHLSARDFFRSALEERFQIAMTDPELDLVWERYGNREC